MAVFEMDHARDPKEELLSRLGDLSSIEISGNRVLVAVYERPEKTKGGIILTDNARAEDRWQGKMGLIVKSGPLAFDVDSGWKHGVDFREGDWVFHRASDGWSLTIHGVLCRVLYDEQLVGRAATCDEVF